MSNGINPFLRLLQGQQQAAPTPMANMQRPYQLPGGRTPPMALSGLQKAQAAQLARGTGGARPRVLPMLANVAQGKYISPLQKALMQQATEQPVVDTSTALQGTGDQTQTTFGQRFSQPTTQALLGAAVEGADASGWSKVPVSTGQVLARMGAGAMKGYGDAIAAQVAAEERDLSKKYTEAKIAEMATPKKTALVENLIAAGLKPGTQAFQDALLKAATKPQTVFMGGDEQKKEAYKAALATRKDMIKQVNADRELGVRLDTSINLLESGVETGRLQAAMLPLKQIAREVGALSDEDVANLSNQEVIDSITAYLTPRMRVTGSGASSDRDMDFFQRSTVRMANTPEANLVIAKMQRQVMDYNRRRLDLFDDYVKEKGDDFGFGRYADEKMGGVYQKANTDEELDKMISDGRLREGDVFFNGITGEFDILTKDMM